MSSARPPRPVGRNEEISDLIEVLRAADQRLDELLGGEVDTVTDRAGETILLRRAQGYLRESEQVRQAAILNALPPGIALLDARGVIVSVNLAWPLFADSDASATPETGVGANYLETWDRARGGHSSGAAAVVAGIRSVIDGQAASYSVEYSCDRPTGQRWVLLLISALPDGPLRGTVVMLTDITKRVQAARAFATLSESTERRERVLTMMLTSISDFTYIFDREGRFVFANQPMLDFLGIPMEAALGKTCLEVGCPQALAEMFQRQVEDVFRSGKTVSAETPYPKADGSLAYHEYIYSPAFAADAGVEFVVGCMRDITRRKRSELALKESLAEFGALVASMPQIVFITGADGQTTYLNQRWADYTGLSVENGLGDGWVSRIHPDDRQRVQEWWQGAVAAGSTGSCEIRMQRANGAYRWWLVDAVALLDDNTGDTVKWIGTATDVHELKVAEMELSRTTQELRRQRSELRVLFDLVPARIWFKDTKNNFLRANKLGAKSIGRTVAEVEGRPVSALYPEQASAFYASDLRIISTGIPSIGQVEQETDADGNQVWIQKDKVPYRDEHGNVVGIVVMSHDITTRKREQDELRDLNADLELRVRSRTAELKLARDDAEEANRGKSVFLASMSHEIRTPMTGLLGLLELLDLSTLDDEQHSTLTVARESGSELLRIIDDILDFSKIEADCLELNPAAGSVRQVVENACRLHQQIASIKNLTLDTEVAPGISPFLAFDSLRLGQILNNFLNNAIKFTDRGGVSILVELAGDTGGRQSLRFHVRDTGIGMSAEQMSRLFQPFAQAGSDTSARYGGTGLGLVISRRLAELMDGTVDIESKPGEGTTLTLCVTFDVCKGGARAHPGASTGLEQLQALVAGRRGAPTTAEAEAEGTLLLLVDDHPVNRMVLIRQVASLGYAAEAVADGIQALQAWRSGRFGAVITDCNMPHMTGYELTGAIRNEEAQGGKPRIPIIACTANALPAAAEFCIAAGMDDCVVKPADLAAISRKLAQWLPLGRVGRAPPELPAAAQRLLHPPSGSHGLLDLVLLSEISGGDLVAQADILAEFRRTKELDATALRKAAAAGDLQQVIQFSHRLKGSCLMLGATLLAGVCAMLETASAAGSPAEVLAAMCRFETALLRLDRYLDAFSSIKPPAGR